MMARRRKTNIAGSPPTLRGVMSQKVATITPGTTLHAAAKALARKRISCLVVVKRGKPLGIISERDIVRALARGRNVLEDLHAERAMSSPVEVLPACTPLDKALVLMQEKGYRRFPIVDEDGSLAGIVTQTDVLRAFSRELALAHDKLKDMAVHDVLTGLYNRRFFIDALERQFLISRRYGDSMALIMIDLDDFKRVNDLQGHQFGDMVLREVAEILARGRKTDLVARFGGEEFVVLAQKLSQENAMRVAERLREAVASTGRTASLGIAYYPDPDTMNMEDLIRHSDIAMYRSKQAGKNRVTMWSNEMEDFASVRK